MFSKNDTVIVGVSGGADSVMLLHVLNTIKEDYKLNLIVAHVNHKIRKGGVIKQNCFNVDICFLCFYSIGCKKW